MSTSVCCSKYLEELKAHGLDPFDLCPGCKVMVARHARAPFVVPAPPSVSSSSSSPSFDSFRSSPPIPLRFPAPLVNASHVAARGVTVWDGMDQSHSSSASPSSCHVDVHAPDETHRAVPVSVLAESSSGRADVLLMLGGHVYVALLDTGASCSVMDSSIVQELGLHVNQVAGNVLLASSAVSMDRIGITDSLSVTAVFPVPSLRLPSLSFRHAFEIMPIDVNRYQFIIGADLIRFFFPLSIPSVFLPRALSSGLCRVGVLSVPLSTHSVIDEKCVDACMDVKCVRFGGVNVVVGDGDAGEGDTLLVPVGIGLDVSPSVDVGEGYAAACSACDVMCSSVNEMCFSSGSMNTDSSYTYEASQQLYVMSDPPPSIDRLVPVPSLLPASSSTPLVCSVFVYDVFDDSDALLSRVNENYSGFRPDPGGDSMYGPILIPAVMSC